MPNNGTTDLVQRSHFEIATISLALIALIIASIIGNIAVITAVYTSHNLRSELSSLFIINLSITDLSSAVIVIGSSLVAVISDSWILGLVWCDIVCMANYCLIIVSMLTLSFISIDRYYAVTKPLYYNSFITRERVIAMIIYSWLQGVVFSVIPVIFRWINYDYWEGVCAIQWHLNRNEALYYVIVAFVVCFFVPGLVLIIAYSQILKTAKEKCKNLTAGESHPYNTSYKAMYGLITVVVAFFICMTPFSTTKLYKVSINSNNALPPYVNLFSSIIAYLSSVVNPLIYGIFRKDFKRAFRSIFRKYFWSVLVNESRQQNNNQEDSIPP